MFLLTFNSNDALLWILATTFTSGLGSPVVIAAIVSGIFILIAKLIETRSARRGEIERRQRDAEIAGLLTAQNELLARVLTQSPKRTATRHPST